MKQHWHNFRKVRKATAAKLSVMHQLDDDSNPLPDEFSILVWNTFKRNGGAEFDADLQRFAARNEILCLQEVLATDILHLPEAVNQSNYQYSISYQRPDGFYEGVLTSTAAAMDSHCYSLLSVATEPVTNTHKSALISLLPMVSGESLLVINIHMLLFKRRGVFKKELAQILRLCERYKNLPAIFCGDFNTFTKPQLKILDYTLQLEGFSRCQPLHEPRAKRFLDHIYIRGLQLEKMQILDTITSSDHFPLECQLSLKK
jgi:endonuclease/exonuclease/phosphatase (EEP) superfamily protein YafD